MFNTFAKLYELFLLLQLRDPHLTTFQIVEFIYLRKTYTYMEGRVLHNFCICAYLPYMRHFFSVYAIFSLYLRIFCKCVYLIYNAQPLYMCIHRSCAYMENTHIYWICLYMKVAVVHVYVHIRKICAYTKASHIRKIYAYTEVAHIWKMCTYTKVM